jgi:hypothetical protein
MEEPPPKVTEFFNIAFPVYRDVTPKDDIPIWAGNKTPIHGDTERDPIKRLTKMIEEREAQLKWLDGATHKTVEPPYDYGDKRMGVCGQVVNAESVRTFLEAHWKHLAEYEKKGYRTIETPTTILFYGMHIPWIDKYNHKHWKYEPKGCPA